MQVTEQEQVWGAVTELLQEQLNEAVWLSTFSEVRPLEGGDGVFRVRVPSNHVRDRIQTRYLPIVTEALETIVAPGCTLEIVVEADSNTDGDDSDAAIRELDRDRRDGAGEHRDGDGGWGHLDRRPDGTSLLDEAGLNPKHTFETFVKGASNQFALAASLRVAETPARSYNPLFIYGSSGLGKTHLLHAIGHYVHHNYQHHAVLYVSTETFLNDFVNAIRTDTGLALRRRYREIDVLLIDDIQFLEEKEGTQEEFFHTFNSLHGANKQLVISSDRPPDAITTLEERLRSRFKWGLITDIQPPDVETRLAILRNKAERDGVEVPAETLEFIASKISTNIRELEGALIRVTAFASLNQVPITTELAQHLLADLLRDAAPRQRTDAQLLEEMAAILGFDVEALQGKSRQRPLVTARQIAMYVFRDQTELSYPAIARIFGGRDHTTVIHAVDKIQRLMSERKQIYDQVTDLTARLTS
ncbi:MAG: chromosomal replication initiator protein DnaA [Actinomycetota bacterium]|nr:chromosomal replication initiator protein DnaA [Acidimicrobiia bacterium]MDQ3470482.1 chromosomal replication initiator protein DnaA [Actinomycetota bacterium]